MRKIIRPEFTNKVIKGIDKHNVSHAIFMDLSKAFDVLYHTISIRKLVHYGTNGTSLE